ncbi:MAG TPA: rRNA maturation RNase YbeY [Steroidobacteraceae bacterium]|nr:rRNA maturation RNase YbeY [Steroidobacteraceae bacterium]
MSEPLRVEVLRRGRTWSPGATQIDAWARAALGRRAAGRELAVRIVGARESRRLNAHYRGRDRPTNVLSFPMSSAAQPQRPGAMASTAATGMPAALGDLVICSPLVRREAQLQRKSLRAHWAHLVVHGALHLIGYDHEHPRAARRMERREIAVLKRLGFQNPYRSV